MKKNLQNKTAFSLIELSIVILIIGIIVAGVTQSSRMINAFKMNTARNLTQSSPVASMRNLVAWYESTSLASFADSESDDTQAITTWYDINPTSTNKNNLTSSSTSRPLYIASCVNSLPCVRFDGSNDYLTNSSSDISGVELTIFIVAKRIAASAYTSAMVIYKSGLTYDWDNENSCALFYEGPSSNQIKSECGPAYALPLVTHPGNNNTYIAMTIFNGTNNTMYLNGAGQTPASHTGTFNSQVVLLGARWTESARAHFYNGNIAEVIIFNRALKNEERDAIETYLGKKWNVTVS